MTLFQRTLLPALLVLLLASPGRVSATGADDEFFASSAALMAVQLYTEIGRDLAREFVAEGRSEDAADEQRYARIYTADQLHRMQSQVSQVVNACLREARINVRDHTPDSA